ncbi:hypothetical protein HCA99_00440 [Listeria booriae]|uniref:structural cement protein Gp24 n=1 Tax=Listeria booriae TaxID=1552123 RepID=UPI0016270B4B|nr:hypothetical protein [Listeria booriae]MBC2077674.1 hypothetical protein [Listeria booriae]
MSIPVGEEYMDPNIGIGKLANYQNTQADSALVEGTIPFGSAVQFSDGVAKVLSDKDFYGVALAKEYVPELNGDKIGTYIDKEMVPVVRRGVICVRVEDDVVNGEKAAANKATGNFLPASPPTSTKTEAIGRFKTTAQAGGLAHLEINLP